MLMEFADCTDEDAAVARSLEQRESDEEIARALQEEYDAAYCMSFQDSMKEAIRLQSNAPHPQAIAKVCSESVLEAATQYQKDISEDYDDFDEDYDEDFDDNFDGEEKWWKSVDDFDVVSGPRVMIKDSSDKATAESVLDTRTRLVLHKLLNRGVLSRVDGCVSTGKEAHVFHATSSDGKSCAVKVYKTAVLSFKDRHRYVDGEFRYRHGYAKGSSRKMVRVWAEKEMRNLRRISEKGTEWLRCPEPWFLQQHLLGMEFIVGGKEETPAPRLKDVDVPVGSSKWTKWYISCVRSLFGLVRICKLIHADFSEYNILFDPFGETPIRQLVFIDVAQAVENDHPRAMDFLRQDITNITSFFKRKGVKDIVPVIDLFSILTDANIDADEKSFNRAWESLLRDVKSRESESVSTKSVTEAVFSQVPMPRSLQEVRDVELHAEMAQKGEILPDMYFSGLLGMNKTLSGPADTPKWEEESSEDESDEDESDEEELQNEKEGSKVDTSKRPRYRTDGTLGEDEKRDMRKAHKQAVKEQNRQKREGKMPKKLKKRQEKLSRRRKLRG